jgi:Sec-independent protein translocase protein TatA
MVLFDINFKHLLLVCGFCYLTFSKKDIPFIAYSMGKGIGRVIGILQKGTAGISSYVSKEATQGGSDTKKEVVRRLGEFQQLRNELRTMGSLTAAFPTSLDSAVSSYVRAQQAEEQKSKSNINGTSETNRSSNGNSSEHKAVAFASKGLENKRGDLPSFASTIGSRGAADALVESLEELRILKEIAKTQPELLKHMKKTSQ